ncbi:hypothetical protein ABEY48_19610, partial [Bacillus mycoides]
VTFFYLNHACILIWHRKKLRGYHSSGGIIVPLLFILLFFIVNVLIYVKSFRWRKQQHLYVHPFTFLIDYYIFIIPITVFILCLALPGIFINGNHALDTIMTNIFMIELCLFGLPMLLLWNFYMVYPNLKFLCSLYDKKIFNYEFLKRSTLCLEVILCCVLIPSIHYIVIIFLVGMSLFLEYKIADAS